MNRARTLLGGVLVAWAIGMAPAGAVVAQEATPEGITIPVVETGPPVDGTLSSSIWQKAARVTLGFDRQNHATASEKTTAYLLTDGKSLYVGWDAVQTRTPILANQHNNNSGADLDDEVKIALWPGGTAGVNYQFVSTPIGTRYQVSSENTSYEPTWDAAGHVAGNEFFVTMRVPLSIVRGAQQKAWMINLTRFEPGTQSLYAWSGGALFNGTDDVRFARPLIGMPATVASRPKPRIGLYGLGSIAAPYVGGSTSRSGADISIPVTNTTSLIATIHPDFSNVESDQQTIAPTATRRFYNETRPFFTQGANYYNYMECDACPNEMALYTPSIPTPRNGYAIEGKQGPLTFAAFDAVGAGRNDAAESVVFRTKPRNLFVSAEHISANLPTVQDNTLQFSGKWDDLAHKFIYANYGKESGSLITDASQAKFSEIGAGWYGPNSFTGGGIRKIGAQFNPYDGFFSNSDIAGYGIFSQHTWNANGGKLRSIQVSVSNDSYHATGGRLSLWDLNEQVDILTKSKWEFIADSGASYLLVGNVLTPVTQESQHIVYHARTATPTSLVYYTGIYGDGRLDSWFRSTTMRLGNRGLLSLEADDTRQYLRHPQANGSNTNIQWLERASYALQIDANTSLALGVRRFFGPPPTPNGGNTCNIPRPGDPNALGFCPNVSLAYYKRSQHDELYVIYGSAGNTITVPQFLVKYIHYIGAEKGT